MMKQFIGITLLGICMLWGEFVFSQPIIQIRGTQDSLTIKNQVMQYLDHLDIRENIYLSVLFTSLIPDQLEGLTLCGEKRSKGYQILLVRIDANQNEMRQRVILAHEMIHVKQYAKGEIHVINKEQVMWKGRKHHLGLPWGEHNPWEREAYKKDHWLARQYTPQPETPLAAMIKGQPRMSLFKNKQ